MSVSKHIISQIEKKIGAVIYVQSVGGGCIAQSYTIVSIKGTYFLKTNYPCAEMYKQEALGLLEIAKSNTI
ncbi:MAG TPA: fructosamine kinase family protein, partial [Bacteroidales bacterium]|nr:fructosamine kinase family protein [Bacteroidales bacterium]